jgi:hypothetical protein
VAADYVDLTLLAVVAVAVVVVVVVVVVEHSAALSTLLLTVEGSFASRLPACFPLSPLICSDLRVSPAGPLRPIRRIWWSTGTSAMVETTVKWCQCGL